MSMCPCLALLARLFVYRFDFDFCAGAVGYDKKEIEGEEIEKGERRILSLLRARLSLTCGAKSEPRESPEDLFEPVSRNLYFSGFE